MEIFTTKDSSLLEIKILWPSLTRDFFVFSTIVRLTGTRSLVSKNSLLFLSTSYLFFKQKLDFMVQGHISKSSWFILPKKINNLSTSLSIRYARCVFYATSCRFNGYKCRYILQFFALRKIFFKRWNWFGLPWYLALIQSSYHSPNPQ